ncbi:MAG: hypothetical protein ACUVTP_12325 [Candidatus Fervidibacter sp.]|uniref:hypothetical protein n=1 Tax=Candidatus Fervidibacter sp. TaxID=3100871 RepID=UPI0040499C1C
MRWMYLVLLVFLAFLGGVLKGQQGQIGVPLRYQLQWDDRNLPFSFYGGLLKPMAPGDAKLPPLSDLQPKFLKGKFVDGERLFVIAKQGDEWLLYADTNGDNDLTDKRPFRGYIDGWYRHFGPTPMRFRVNGKTVLHHIGISQLLESTGAVEFYARQASCRTGNLMWEGKPVTVTVKDSDFDGAITPKDRILWDDGQEQLWLPAVGRIGKDGRFFRYEVVPTGERLVIEPLSLPSAPVRYEGDVLKLGLEGEGGEWLMEGKDGQLIAPVGEFRLHEMLLTRRDRQGRLWQLLAFAFGPAAPKLTISPSGTTLNVEPLEISVLAHRKGNEFEFSLEIKTTNEMRVNRLLVDNQRPPEPKLRLAAPNGKVIAEPQFHYG